MISLGIFIIMSIIAFILCFVDKDIKKLNADMPTKIIASILFGAITGMISAVFELFM